MKVCRAAHRRLIARLALLLGRAGVLGRAIAAAGVGDRLAGLVGRRVGVHAGCHTTPAGELLTPSGPGAPASEQAKPRASQRQRTSSGMGAKGERKGDE